MGIINKALDWVVDEESFALSLAKMLLLTSIPVGAIAASACYFSAENAKALEQTFKDLDNRPTAVFQSVSGCVSKGYPQTACNQSQRKALDISEEFGTALRYSSGSECHANHAKCDEYMWLQPIVVSSGKSVVVSQIPHTGYKPPVVAWQAAANDLRVAVPLYSGPKEQTVVRNDGKMFDLSPGQ